MKTFQELQNFLTAKMQMQHIYQPVMIMALLESGGECSQKEIAKAILSNDESQLEYYEKITRDMVGRVLRRHGIVQRTGKSYLLSGYDRLSGDERKSLIGICKAKLEQYVTERGEKIWNHRKKTGPYISGTLKYEVLKRAKFRCDLCGVSAEEKALEVDHIIPRNHDGTNDLTNLQALCYTCNAMKRDRDDTDFRVVRASYDLRLADCLFCNQPREHIIAENELAIAIRDNFPVTPLHTLVIPKRHTETYFDLGSAEHNACNELIAKSRGEIQQRDKTVKAFNIGMNCGETAGQTIFHAHIHLIPRRNGDVENPRGGIRHMIPAKGEYPIPKIRVSE